jgi:transcriptional regulator with XRE-family HTH domain
VASPLGEKIKNLRTEKGLSLEQLAQMTDSSKSYLWELENREQANPSLEKINKLAVALNVTAEFLVSAPESSPDNKVADEAFFRKYQLLPDPEKKKLRKILDAWEDE